MLAFVPKVLGNHGIAGADGDLGWLAVGFTDNNGSLRVGCCGLRGLGRLCASRLSGARCDSRLARSASGGGADSLAGDDGLGRLDHDWLDHLDGSRGDTGDARSGGALIGACLRLLDDGRLDDGRGTAFIDASRDLFSVIEQLPLTNLDRLALLLLGSLLDGHRGARVAHDSPRDARAAGSSGSLTNSSERSHDRVHHHFCRQDEIRRKKIAF